MRKILALLLMLAMLFSALPFAAATSASDCEDVWEEIFEIESRKIRPKRGTAATEEDYAAIVDDIIRAVEASDSYKENSLVRHGNFFFWETLDGEPNGYSPRLRARLRNAVIADAEPEDFSGIETTAYATRNGSNGMDVAIFQPYIGLDNSFTTQYQTEGASIAKAIGGTCTVYKTTDATIDKIADAMESCAVVVFDSHGDTDYDNGKEDYVSKANTSYILLQTNAGFTVADQAAVSGPYGTYYHAYYAGSYRKMNYYAVDGTAIANHMERSAPNNLLWMALCLGMATDGLNGPMRNKGVGVVYGYSQSVTFDGDYFWEETFWNGMKSGKTVAAAISEMKTKCGRWDYSKELYAYNKWKTDSDMCSTIAQARKNYAAFPIVVSAQDDYPGHGNVDNLQMVQSTWKPEAVHTHAYQADTVAPTCTEKGYTRHTCTICSDFYKDTETDAIGHTFAYGACTVCGAIDPNNHTHDDKAEVVASTCTEKGYTLHTCTACGSSFTDNETSALGHNFVDGVCIRCGEKDPTYVLPTFDCDGGIDCPSYDFADVNAGDWYHEYVDYAVSNSLLNGMDKTVFAPNTAMTRAMLVTVLYRAENEPPVAGKNNPFADVSDGRWYTDAVIWAANEGIVNGTSETTFEPDEVITREQIAAILFRYALNKGAIYEETTALLPFPDIQDISAYARDAMSWCVENGIIGGSDGYLLPLHNATRAQIAAMLYRYLNQ